MAVTQTVAYPFFPRLTDAGSQRKAVARYTLTGTYVTGGFSTTANELGISGDAVGIEDVQVLVRTPSAAAVVGGYWDASTSKIVLNTATAELANATSTTGLVLEVTTYAKA